MKAELERLRDEQRALRDRYYEQGDNHLADKLDDVVDDLDAILARFEGGDWRPIDTAPKDGTEVLGWRRDAGIFLTKYCAPVDFMSDAEELEGLDEESAETPDWMFAGFLGGGRLEKYDAPTHWMPLLEPPEDS